MGLESSAETGVGNWRQRAIICRTSPPWVCSLGGGCWVMLCWGRVCWVMVYTALVPAVPQRFNYIALCLHFFFFFPLPLLLQSLAIFWKQNTECCTSITQPCCTFPVGCLLKNQLQKIAKEGKNCVLCHTVHLKCSANTVYSTAQGQRRGIGAQASSWVRVTLKRGISQFNT